MLKDYVQMFNSLKATSSRLEKEALLKKYQNDEGFLEILKFCYNPQIVTGLAKRKIRKYVETPTYTILENIFEAMQFVADNNTGSDNIICSVQHFIRNLNTEEEKELAESILVKDMPYGISLVTLNKVYGKDFISKYGVQLAGTYNPNENQFEETFSLSLKLDGNRCTFFVTESSIKAYTRSGKEYEGLIELVPEFAELPKGMVYDGELIAENPDNLDSKDLFRLTQTIVRKKGNKTGLNFIMFDMLPISEFNRGKSKKVYGERMSDMGLMFATKIDGKLHHIKKVPIFYIGQNKSEIDKWLNEVISKGFEGLMINLLSAPYECRRIKGLLKVKKFHTIDLRVVDLKADIRNSGKCGSLVCDYHGYRVDVAGLKESEKIEFWNNPKQIVGKIIEVKYFEESENANGSKSLRFPSFIRVRDDKNEVSYY